MKRASRIGIDIKGRIGIGISDDTSNNENLPGGSISSAEPNINEIRRTNISG
jgi:hypothetical protein